MIGLLASIKSGITTLTGRLTSTRAGYLDNLDAAMSTRAPASTALSSATWTGTKAGYLDAPISGVLALAYVGYVNVNVSLDANGKGNTTASIGTRDSTKTIIICNGAAQGGYSVAGACSAQAWQSNYNEITVYANGPAGVSAVNVTVYVVEFA